MDPLDIRRNRPAETNASEPPRETASQTAGPYVHIGCLPNMVGIEGIYPEDLTDNPVKVTGEAIQISGRVYDGNNDICKDIMLEFWQADEQGDYINGIWRRAGTNLESGEYRIETVLPGTGTNEQGVKLAPFISVWIAARGINIGLQTRIYFPQFENANAQDPHLALVPPDRRKTIMAASIGQSQYRFDVRLQGEAETVFFDT